MTAPVSCDSALSCSTQFDVLKVCYTNARFDSSDPFCDCDNLLGFTGNECDQGSSQTDFISLTSTLFLFVLIALFIWNLYGLFHYIRKRDSLNSLYHSTTVEVAKYKVHLGLTLALLAMICLIVERCVHLVNMFTDTSKEISSIRLVLRGDLEIIALSSKIGQDVLQSLTFFLAIFSVYTVVLYLRDMVLLAQLRGRNWNHLYIAAILLVITLLVTLVSDILRFSSISSIVKALVSVAVASAFIYTKKEIEILVAEFEGVKKAGATFKKVLNRVAVQCNTALVFNAALFLAYSIGIRFAQEAVKPGEIHYITVIQSLTIVCLIFNITGVVYFSIRFVNNPVLNVKGLTVIVNDDNDPEGGVSYFEPSRKSLTSPHVEGSVVKLSKSKKANIGNSVKLQDGFKAGRESLSSPMMPKHDIKNQQSML